MLIVAEDFAVALTATTEISPVNASMPGSRLRERQVSRRARITTIADTPYFGASMEGSPIGSISPAYNVVAVIGYDGASSRNMFRNAHRTMVDALWAKAGFVTGNTNEGSPSDFPSFRAWGATITAGVNTCDQALTSKPGKGDADFGSAALSNVACFLVKQDANDADLRIIASETAGVGTNSVEADFDLSAGTAGSATAAGTFTAPTAPDIVALNDGWYLCRLYYLTGTEDELNIRYQAITPGGSTTMVGNETWFIGPAAQMLGTASLAAAEYPITSHSGTGPMFHVRLAHTAHDTADDVSAGWQHCATRNKLRGFDRFSFFHKYATSHTEPLVRVELWDPDNVLTYMEAGRLIAGDGIELSGVLAPRYALGGEETGGENEMDGGQIYRAQRKVRRRQEIRLQYMTEAQAMDDIYRMIRVQGRSRQILVIGDEANTKYAQEFMVYGFIDSLDPMPMQAHDSSGNTLWEWGFTIRETP